MDLLKLPNIVVPDLTGFKVAIHMLYLRGGFAFEFISYGPVSMLAVSSAAAQTLRLDERAASA